MLTQNKGDLAANAGQSEIDFVIFWVDGDDPEHRRKRQHYLREFRLEMPKNQEQSFDTRRFVQHEELRYCLRSIKQHAPWYRKIWLITDRQIPDFLNPKDLSKDRIELLDHTKLFRGKEQYLPTFNSRALATLVHEIPELSERYLIGNDDLMLSAPISESFFFEKEQPIIYGDWIQLQPHQCPTLHQLGTLNSARMQGFDESRFLRTSHGFLPFDKSCMRQLKSMFPEAFQANIQHRFRHESQFNPESLYNHYCLRTGKGKYRDTGPMVHFSFELCRSGEPDKIDFLFDLLKRGERKMFCLNEYQSLYPRIPRVRIYLETLCGAPLASERVALCLSD